MRSLLLLWALVLYAPMVMADDLLSALQSLKGQNPTLKAQAEVLRQSEEGVIQARAGFLPTVTGSARWSREESDDGVASQTRNPKSYELSVNQPLFTGGRTTASYNMARNTADQSKALAHTVMQEVLLQAVVAYMDVLRDQEILASYDNQVDVLTLHARQTKLRFDLGDVTYTDLQQAEARLAGAKARREQGYGQLKASQARYMAVFGKTPEDLVWPEVSFDVPTDEASAQQEALQNHPQIVAALAALSRAKYGVWEARSGHLPSLSADAALSRREDSRSNFGADRIDDKTMGLNLSIPIFNGGAVSSQVRSAVAGRAKAMYDYDEAKRQVVQQVVDAYYNYGTTLKQVESLLVQVKANELALQGVRQESRSGGRSVLDLLDAEQELLDTKVELYKAQHSKVVADFNLLAALGRLNFDYLNGQSQAFGPAMAIVTPEAPEMPKVEPIEPVRKPLLDPPLVE